MGLSPTILGCLDVVREMQNQTKRIANATHFVLHLLVNKPVCD